MEIIENKEMNIKNSVVVLNEPIGSDFKKTILVFGVGRGGTSFVAGSLIELGIFMGEKIDPLKHEFSPLSEHLEKHELISTFDRYNLNYPIWGWKNPGDLFNFDKYAHHLRNPHVVIVFRNLLDTSISGNMNNGIPLTEALKSNILVKQRLIQFIENTELPTALVSYEGAIKEPTEYIDSIIRFLGLSNVEEQRYKNAIKFCSSMSYAPISDRISKRDELEKIRLCQEAEIGKRVRFQSLSQASEVLEKKVALFEEDIEVAQKICDHLAHSVKSKHIISDSQLVDCDSIFNFMKSSIDLGSFQSIKKPGKFFNPSNEEVKKVEDRYISLRAQFLELKKERFQLQRKIELLDVLNQNLSNDLYGANEHD